MAEIDANTPLEELFTDLDRARWRERRGVVPLDHTVDTRDRLPEHFAAIFIEGGERRGLVLNSSAHLANLLCVTAERGDLEASTQAFNELQRTAPHTTALECARACRSVADNDRATGAAAEALLLETEATTWMLIDRVAAPVVAQEAWHTLTQQYSQEALGNSSLLEASPRALLEVASMADGTTALAMYLVKWLELHSALEETRRVAQEACRAVRHREASAEPADENQLMRRVWALLRTGQGNDALILLSLCGHPLESAALCGWQTYDGRESGNPNRRAWAALSAETACTPEQPEYKRAVYGVLAGAPEAALCACRTYEDRLWVAARTLLEECKDRVLVTEARYQDSALADLEQRRPTHITSVADVFDFVEGLQPWVTAEPLPEELGEEDPRTRQPLALLQSQTAQSGAAAAAVAVNGKNQAVRRAVVLLHEVQKLVLLRRVPKALELIRRSVEAVVTDKDATPEAVEVAQQLLRFGVHMALFFGENAPEMVRRYTELGLVRCGQLEVIALYAAMLPREQQEGCFATVLFNIITSKAWQTNKYKNELLRSMALTAESRGISIANVCGILATMLEQHIAHSEGAAPSRKKSRAQVAHSIREIATTAGFPDRKPQETPLPAASAAALAQAQAQASAPQAAPEAEPAAAAAAAATTTTRRKRTPPPSAAMEEEEALDEEDQGTLEAMLAVLYLAGVDAKRALEMLQLAVKYARGFLDRGLLSVADRVLSTASAHNDSLYSIVHSYVQDGTVPCDRESKALSDEATSTIQEYTSLLGYIQSQRDYKRFLEGKEEGRDVATRMMKLLCIDCGFMGSGGGNSGSGSEGAGYPTRAQLRRKLVPQLVHQVTEICRMCELDDVVEEMLRVVSDNTHSVYKELSADQVQEFLDLVTHIIIAKTVVPL